MIAIAQVSEQVPIIDSVDRGKDLMYNKQSMFYVMDK